MEIMIEAKGRDTDTHAATEFQIGSSRRRVAWGLGRGCRRCRDGRLIGDAR